MSEEKSIDRDFLEFLVKSIVDHPDDVVVEKRTDDRGSYLSLRVNPEDMGHVIGQHGATAKAVRLLLRIVGAKNNLHGGLKIEEPEGGLRAHHHDEAEGGGTE